MRHVLSTHLFVNHRLSTVWLDRIWDCNIPAVEIFCARQHLDYRNRAQIAELAAWFRDADMKLHSIHAPMYNDEYWGRSGPQAVIDITEPAKAKRIAMVDEIKRALEIAESIPFQYMVQHLGVSGQEYDERRLDAGFDSLDELSNFARMRGVEVLLENIPNRLASADRLNAFLGATHMKLGFCFDVGHAHMDSGIPASYEIMQERIRSTHLHDNNGKEDQHLFPTMNKGTIDWKRTMELLGSRPDQYPLLLELKEDPALGPHPFDKVAEIFDKLESL
ncbi:MAG TPA: sugar phosphate isomerase/epimerase family protein [Bryobacteraceae bacterium]|nr:sugar phosphate isomerase/epimerase family protein [Bryobacteraceae bacterium]